MFVQRPLVPLRWVQCLRMSLLLAFLAAAFALPTPVAHGQRQAVQKLTLSQIEQLVSHGVPDSTMAAQIDKRGIAFKPTADILQELQAKGAGPLTIAAIQPASSGAPAERSADEAMPVAGGIPGGIIGGVPSMHSPPPPPFPHVAPSHSRVRISAGVAEGLLVQKTDPVYPPLARAARISGTVVLQAVISKTGSVDELRVVSGHPLLQQAALDAVKKWRYRPLMLNGEPVEAETTIIVTFDLNK